MFAERKEDMAPNTKPYVDPRAMPEKILPRKITLGEMSKISILLKIEI